MKEQAIIDLTFCISLVRKMVLEKFFKVTELYLESGKIDILKKSQGKLKQFNSDTADLILLKTETNMWVHCDLNEFITLNQ